jgi:hypothetical protein
MSRDNVFRMGSAQGTVTPKPIGTIPIGTIHAFARASGPQRRGHVEPPRLTSIPHLRHCPQRLDLAPGRLSPAPASRLRRALASRFALRESCFAMRRSAASAARSRPARMPSQIRPAPPRRTWRSKGASWRSLWQSWEYPCATTEVPTVAHRLRPSFRDREPHLPLVSQCTKK